MAKAGLAVGSAPGRSLEYSAGLGEAGRRQCGHLPPKPIPRDRMDVVKIDDAVGWYSVGSRECEFGNETTTSSGECSHNDRPDLVGYGVTSEHEYRPVAARVDTNQTSPRRIGPVRPVFGGTPVGDIREGEFVIAERLCLPALGIIFTCRSVKVAPERLAQKFRAVNAEPLRPELCIGSLGEGTLKLSIVIRSVYHV